MMPMKVALLASTFALASMQAAAAPLPPVARAEIDGVLQRLQTSGCEFNRNGSWYTGTEARDHLQKKLDYLERKDAVHSAEQFIELAASNSSVTGKPYLVLCSGTAPVQSRVWLTGELQAQRSRHGK